MNHAAQARTFEIPGDAWDRISRCPGQGGVEALGVAYREGTRCPGIAILINPTVRATMAVVLGTLASEEDPASTRVYVIDSRRTHLSLLLRKLARENLAGQVTFYHGRPDEFFRDLPLLPGFICVDSQVGGLNLPGLCGRLPGGAGVLLLSDPDRPSVGISARECIRRGLMEEVYVTAGAVLYRTTNSSSGTGISLSTGAHNILQAKLHERYFLSTIDAAQDHTPVADLTEEIRRDFSFQISVNSGYGVWPYVNPDPVDLPWTMPGGKAWPKISIVTPSFNQGPYIEETILSVVNQGYPNVEHIIIDGGSTDGTRQILEKYRNKIAHVVIEQDNGQSHAINKGMLLATGDILTWLNSDDRLAPGALASVALGLETSGADMVAGICRLYRNGQCERQHLTACADGPLPLQDLLDLDHGWNAGQFFYQPEVMFTRELWLRAGGHVNDWLHYSMDYELWLRFAEVGARLHVIGRPVAWFRLHDQQKTHVTERFQSELVVVRNGFLKTRGLTAAKAKTGLFRSALRVTFLNDHGPLFGAGIAHVRMARCVARAGHNVTLISIISGRRSDAEVPNYSVESVIDRIAATQPDLVIVGNLHNAAVEPLLLSFLCERFPTMVMMHDFWILTGRCAYTGDCAKYLTKCDETCPTADQYPALPPSEIVEAWRKKRSLLQSSQRPVLLTNSSWTDAFTRSALSSGSMAGGNGPTVERFQLSFPLDIFRPRDRRSCRDVFQLPQDSFIVLLAASLQDPRKGGLPFLEALERLQLPNLLVVTVGPIGDQPERSLKLLQLGYITDPHQVARLCSAADVVAVPSVAETFGQVCIESIACGTPVVGYPVTGIQEALTDGVTGLLATDTSPASLAAAVQQLYASPDLRRDLSRWGRLHVENNWSEFSAYRHLFLAMHAAGFADALNLRRNIGFIANDPGVPPIQNVWQNRAQWAPLRGVGWQEKAPEHGLDALWWIYGPSAMVEVFAKVSGPHVVLIAYRNFHDQQRLTLRCNGNVLGTFALPNTGFHNGRMLVLNTRLDVGANMLHFQSSKFNSQEHDSRQLAIMLTELLVEPSTRSARDELYGDARPEQVLASVWGETH